jgi:hypothetical protein
MRIKPSEVALFRKRFEKKGIELINISTLCDYKLGTSGWCSGFNEPEETIHHIQVHYRGEIVANINALSITAIDEEKYAVFITNEDDVSGADFIIFKINYGKNR